MTQAETTGLADVRDLVRYKDRVYEFVYHDAERFTVRREGETLCFGTICYERRIPRVVYDEASLFLRLGYALELELWLRWELHAADLRPASPKPPPAPAYPPTLPR